MNKRGKFLKKLSVVLRRWGSIARSLSIINRVDNANWPISSSHCREFKADVSSVGPSSERKFFLYCLFNTCNLDWEMLDRDDDSRCYGDVTVAEVIMMTMMMMKCDNDYYN